jgi:hypothetical protein
MQTPFNSETKTTDPHPKALFAPTNYARKEIENKNKYGDM